ncbi:hypothetical protein [Phycicoccus flavus]|uniref:hypothetical protein n=1 Tax=Phycicoccus flavus TaxID=2502783 RepID=UPI000FEB7BE3|nr:hypothetical protein [Phycicoccus flavus]NHA70323.1 hypothetical protein [Phycicoccus flavus]
MPVVTHPGPTAPAAPTVSLETPDRWSALPAGDALLRASGPGARGGAVTVVVRHLVRPGQDPVTAVLDGSAAAAGPPGTRVEDAFAVLIRGREWQARHVGWDDAGVPVLEVHLVTALPPAEGAGRHLLVVGRARGHGLEEDHEVLRAVLDTLLVDGDAG